MAWEMYHYTILVPGDEIDLAVAEREAATIYISTIYISPDLSTKEVAKNIANYLYHLGWQQTVQEILIFDKDWKILGIAEISWKKVVQFDAVIKPFRGEEG